MARDRRLGEPGQRRVGDAARPVQAIGDAAQAGAEHHRRVGAVDAELLGGGVRRPRTRSKNVASSFMRPRLRRRVEERRHRVQERPGRFEVRQVSGARDRDEAGARDRGRDRFISARGVT